MLKVRKPSPILVFAAVLLVLLPLLAYLQYTWLGKVSEGEREQMRASLRRAADEFRDEFDREISAIHLSFQPADDYVAAYFEWSKAARYPRLIDSVLIARNTKIGPRVERLNTVIGQFEPAEWPISLANLKAALTEMAEQSSDGMDVFVRYLPHPIDPQIPALFIPVLRPPFEPSEYLILILNLECIQKEVFPSLAQTLSADYSVKVIDRSDPSKVIFRAGPLTKEDGTGDATTNLFSHRPPDLVAAKAAAIPLVGAKRDMQKDIFSVRVFRKFSVNKPFAAGVRLDGDDGAWQLVITHRSGSVDAAVAQARTRNLAISSGILLLLAVSVAMIVISTERARRLAQQQMEFTSAVSHELRTPLAVICSAGENLADGVIDDPQRAQRYGALVRDEGRRLSEMIEQVLDFAGIKSGRKIYNLRPTDVREVITEAIDAFCLQARELGFVIEKHSDENLPQIMADKPAIVRAVQNLIGNALKYSGNNRWIGVRAEAVSSGVAITIEDRGPGIPADELPHIFEPFYRGRDAVAGQIKGSGLGLSLVKEIVEEHGGTVNVAGASGKGSSFRIVIPTDV